MDCRAVDHCRKNVPVLLYTMNMQETYRKWTEFRVELDGCQTDVASVLQQLADVFHGFDLGGVVIEDPTEMPEEGWGDLAQPARQPAVAAYLPQNPNLETRLQALRRQFEELKTATGIAFQLVLKEVDEEDWAESWKRFFKPIRVGDDIVVKPTWEPLHAGAGDLVIDIDPGMAFGTGDHPTTRLCLELIRQYLIPGSLFLDVGTGSGILSILAARIGAGKVWAVDRDPAALVTAAENLRRNGAAADRCLLVCGHLLQAFSGRVQLVAANILSETILELAADLPRILLPDGVLIASGINAANGQRVASSLESCGFTILRHRRQEDWVALACRLRHGRPSAV